MYASLMLNDKNRLRKTYPSIRQKELNLDEQYTLNFDRNRLRKIYSNLRIRPPVSLLSTEINYLDLRAAIITENWGSSLPTSTPSVVTNQTGVGNAKDTWPSDCSRVDQITVSTQRGGVSRVHLCYPAASPALHAVRNRLILMHNGHSESYLSDRNPGTGSAYLMYRLLRQGYHVLSPCMPTDGWNASQSFTKLDSTPVTISNHDFSVLETDGAKPLRFFVDGSLVAINYVLNLFGWTYVDAVGISGGGWTIDFISSLDTRIRRSIPVFGSLPFYLRLAAGGPGDNGDWEQSSNGPWWTILGDYESTYILNCIDNGRKRIQCLGMTDTIFPAATILPQISAYQAFVDSKVPVGQHVIWIDSTAAGHWYTESMIDQIVNYLE